MSPLELAEQVRFRALVDSFQAATGAHWVRRAAMFDWAAPRQGDYRGHAGSAEIAARADRCREVARLCRAHAALVREVIA